MSVDEDTTASEVKAVRRSGRYRASMSVALCGVIGLVAASTWYSFIQSGVDAERRVNEEFGSLFGTASVTEANYLGPIALASLASLVVLLAVLHMIIRSAVSGAD